MRLKEIRKSKKLRQSEVADVINCSQAVYSRYENGERTPSPDIIKALAAFFGVSADYLLGMDEATEERQQEETPTVVVQEEAPAPDRKAERIEEAAQILRSMTDEQYQMALNILRAMKK